MNARALRASSSCSGVSTKRAFMGSVRQAEHALGDDVELDLAGAALDRVRARAQPVARAAQLVGGVRLALPADAVVAGQLHAQLLAPLVELGAVQLEHRRRRAGRPPRRRLLARAL